MKGKNRVDVGPDFFRKAKFGRFEGDWFAVDEVGQVGFFAGGLRGAIPVSADIERTSEAIDAIARAAAAKLAGAGYRSAAMTTNDPVFDPPMSSEGGPLHEQPIDGYPHLVFSDDPPRLREVVTLRTPIREVIAARSAGFLAEDLDARGFTWLHDDEAICIGCRAACRPEDPQPRAPEAIATAGLYAFAHTGGDADCPYVRMASPSIAADLADLEPVVVALARLVVLPVVFANATTIEPWQWFDCR
jgi:hypothetical protein